jgi:hypothetical protein
MLALPMQFSREDSAIFIEVGASLLPLTAQDVRSAFTQSAFSRCFLQTDYLQTFLQDYADLQLELRQQLIHEGYRLKRQIAIRRDAELVFEIAVDKMSVVAILTAAWGGAHLSANDVVKAAQEAGIVFGFQKEAIIRLVTTASKAEPGAHCREMIALGRPMAPGADSQFLSLYQGKDERDGTPVLLDNGKADLRDFGVIPSVAAGEALMRRVPPTAGIDGMTVDGEVTAATAGQAIEWEVGEGAAVSDHDADLMIAARDGMPRLLEHGMCVDEVFAVKTVDLSTGHIQFRGSVVINGDVHESMRVLAGGHVYIKGTFEGALVESGGDIQIGGAIIGHQLSQPVDGEWLSTVVKARGNVQCNIAQYARIECAGQLSVNKQITHCHVNAGSVLAGTGDKPQGKIVGGTLSVATTLLCGALGAPSESTVHLNFNRELDPLTERISSLRQSVNNIKQEMEQIRLSLEQLKLQKPSSALQEMMKRLIADYDLQKRAAMALIDDIKKLEIHRAEIASKCQLHVFKNLFAGVEIRLLQDSILIKQQTGASKVLFVEQKLQLQPA